MCKRLKSSASVARTLHSGRDCGRVRAADALLAVSQLGGATALLLIRLPAACLRADALHAAGHRSGHSGAQPIPVAARDCSSALLLYPPTQSNGGQTWHCVSGEQN